MDESYYSLIIDHSVAAFVSGFGIGYIIALFKVIAVLISTK